MPRYDALFVRTRLGSNREATFESECWRIAEVLGRDSATAVLFPETNWIVLSDADRRCGASLAKQLKTEVIWVEVLTTSGEYFAFQHWRNGKRLRSLELISADDSDGVVRKAKGAAEGWERAKDESDDPALDAQGEAWAAATFYGLPGFAAPENGAAHVEQRSIGKPPPSRDTWIKVMTLLWLAAALALATALRSAGASGQTRVMVLAFWCLLLIPIVRSRRVRPPFVSRPY